MRIIHLEIGAWIAFALLVALGCNPKPTATPPPSESTITNYLVRGVVKSLKRPEREAVIRHEEIPGYMPAMTMPFTVREARELDGVDPGDSVEFRLRVTETDGWIDQVQVVTKADPATRKPVATNTPPPAATNAAFRVLPNVPELKPGDLVPDHAFTNQLGQALRLGSFRGQALAVSFIFTRCPFPLFCPRMSERFAEVQSAFAAQKVQATNWHLLSVTFDPEYDTPAVLKAYGQRWKADPERWTLATGGFDQIEPFATSVGLYFGRGVSIADQNHNLRTLVIGPDGRLVQIFRGNEWSAEELVQSLREALSKPEAAPGK
ncbi:MAG: hypothetical protein RLZ45_765 [Verrucomicrobiota bacterium]|jgi:protein SCO1/2